MNLYLELQCYRAAVNGLSIIQPPNITDQVFTIYKGNTTNNIGGHGEITPIQMVATFVKKGGVQLASLLIHKEKWLRFWSGYAAGKAETGVVL